jgi:hypothetical protein
MAKKKTPAPREKRSIPKVDMDELTDTIQADLASHGVIIQSGREYSNLFDLRRPCGLIDLDVATGGGLPPGLSQIDGPDGAGKNYLVNRYFAMVQRLYGDEFCGFMVCLEYPFDKDFARKAGFVVPMSEYEIEVEQRKRENEGREMLTDEEMEAHLAAPGKFYVIEAPEAEAALEAVIRYVDSNGCQIGAVDSWDAMLTAPEAEAGLEDDPRIARAATIQTQWMKKMQAALKVRRRCDECMTFPLEYKKHGKGTSITCPSCGWKATKLRGPFLEHKHCTIIGIRQVRANLKGGLYAREYKSGGAWALKHGKLIDIQVRPGAPLMVNKEKVGKEVVWELTKGKAGTHEGKKGMFRYRYDEGADDLFALVNHCITAEVVKRAGAKIVFEDYTWKSKAEFQDAVEEDPDLKTALYRAALVHAGLGHIRHK